MIFGLHLRDHLSNSSIFIDNEGGPMNPLVRSAHKFLRAPDSESVDHLFLFICKQGVWKLVFCLEILLPLFTVGTHSQDLIALGLKSLPIIPKITGLHGAARSTGFGIEEHN